MNLCKLKIGIIIKVPNQYQINILTDNSMTMMGWSPQCYIPSFVEIGLPVLEKKIFEGFLPYMGVAATLVL